MVQGLISPLSAAAEEFSKRFDTVSHPPTLPPRTSPPSPLPGGLPPIDVTPISVIPTMEFMPNILRPIVMAAQTICAASNITLTLSIPDADLPGVRVIRSAFSSVLAEIVFNAIKYTSAEETERWIEIKLAEITDPNTGVDVIVASHSKSVGSADFSRVFERGFRGDNTQDVAGDGLGLEIARREMRQMGGDVALVEGDSRMQPGRGFVIKTSAFR